MGDWGDSFGNSEDDHEAFYNTLYDTTTDGVFKRKWVPDPVDPSDFEPEFKSFSEAKEWALKNPNCSFVPDSRGGYMRKPRFNFYYNPSRDSNKR